MLGSFVALFIYIGNIHNEYIKRHWYYYCFNNCCVWVSCFWLIYTVTDRNAIMKLKIKDVLKEVKKTLEAQPVQPPVTEPKK